MKVKINTIGPSAKEFVQLRADVGWGDTDLNMAALSLEQSLFHVTARMDLQLVGMGRVIGDGALFFYIQDLAVHPNYQQTGVGGMLMAQIESWLADSASKGATIGLMSAKGKESFYARYGYDQRSGMPLGYGMCKFIK
ncbi:GNAT family N-acetyltransferase [Pseudoalteromonas luteoviolacea]|uniref:GNAT family N-acetyltransferase n=1 Tax=Pseudoalteromonas luteoviolacea TaxID=43657 RepID=UPI001F2EE589|nr:GNAT family N-acetyltransferase [Pseudoalteromonas luteoviolacea]MCF6442665.1 GNAT family N-acetyltransferase [Pseudoalteromonas luteoviolacea]